MWWLILLEYCVASGEQTGVSVGPQALGFLGFLNLMVYFEDPFSGSAEGLGQWSMWRRGLEIWCP